MQKIIAEIATASGLDLGKSEKAIGIMLGLIRAQGHGAKVDELFLKLPGADALADKHGGGLMSQMAGGMMGGPLVAITRMQAAGVNTEQAKIAGAMFLDYAKKTAGETLVRQAAANIPGVGGYL